MFSKILRSSITLSQSSTRSFSFTNLPAGNLYTWGNSSLGLGYTIPQTQQKTIVPQKLDAFNNNVVRVSMAGSHTAVITNEGDLYTFGTGTNGALGHNDAEKNHTAPKLVEFFKKNNLKVIDVACGQHHTIALTDDGDVWTWGFGGKNRSPLMSLFFSSIGALGHNTPLDRPLPTPVESIRELPPFVSVNAGNFFSLALNSNEDLYYWGRGEYGVFGDGSNSDQKLPQVNDFIKKVIRADGISFKKIKSTASQTLALANDGTLWAWGLNEQGQLGAKMEIGIEMHETVGYPTKIPSDKLKGKKVVDFDISENTGVILTDTNEVYWMGLRLAYEPTLVRLPQDKKVKRVAATSKSVCAITTDNEVYMNNKNFMKEKEENLETGVFLADTSAFGSGNIIKMGGSFRNRYAIIKN